MSLEVVPAGTLLWRVHARGDTATAPDRRGLVAASFREVTALAEDLLDGSGFTASGVRKLPRARLKGKVVSALRTSGDLVLVRAEPGAAAPLATGSHGVVRQSTVDFPERTAEIANADLLQTVPGLSRALDDVSGAEWLNDVLEPYGVRVRPPAPDDLPVVFVNYRNGDSMDVVRMIDQRLVEVFGPNAVFCARRSLRAGDVFSDEMLRKAAGAKVLLVIVGPLWDEVRDGTGTPKIEGEHDWVRREIATAFANRVHVAPVLLGARGWVRASALPDDIRALAGLNYLHLRKRCPPEEVATLVDELCEQVPVLDRHRLRGD